MNTLQLSKPYIPYNNRVNTRHNGSRAFIPIGKYLHSLSLPLRLAPPNVNTSYKAGKTLIIIMVMLYSCTIFLNHGAQNHGCGHLFIFPLSS